MDEHLQTIANLSSVKFRDLCSAAKSTLEILNSKDVAAGKLRDRCFSVIQMALQCKHQKINQAAVDLLQVLVRDERFTDRTLTCENDSLIMSALKAVALLPVIKSPVQCRILTIIVEVMCKDERRVTIDTVMEALTLCMQTYGNAEETSVRLACRAAVTQIFSSFCGSSQTTQQDNSQDHIAIVIDSTALLVEVIKRASTANPQSEQVVILLDAIYSILSSQSIRVANHQPFVNVIWRELSPCLMKMLGEPMKNARDAGDSNEPLGRGQRSANTRSRTIFDHPEIALSLYQIMEQLLRLLSGVSGMRSVLEAIFHKALLYPTVEQRSEALRIIRKVAGNEERLVDIIAISMCSKSLTLWTVIVDCIVECSNSTNIDIASEALRTLQAFFDAASRLCAIDSDSILSEQLIDDILNHLSEDGFSKSSADSESLEDEQVDKEHTNAVEKNSSVDLEHAGKITEMLEKLSQKYRPEEVNTVSDCNDQKNVLAEDEIETANYYANEVRRAIPKWLQIKSTIEVDEAIQEFASSFYSEFMLAQKDAFELHGQAQSQFLNSDAIYLATYAALAIMYYCNSERFNELWFVGEVLHSDCIVYSSARWLSAVYRNLTSNANAEDLRSSDYTYAALISVIKDYTGHDAQIMSDVRRIQQMLGKRTEHSQAACKICRWLLLSSWDKILAAPTVFLTLRSKQRRIVRPKAAEAIDQAVYTMLSLARLCILLGLQERNQVIIARLVCSSCPLDELRNLAVQEKADSLTERFNKWPVRKSDVVAMQTILDIAIDCGLHAPECWDDIIRCTEYVWEMEKYLFAITATADQSSWISPGSGCANIDSIISYAQCIDDILPNDSFENLSAHAASQLFHLLIMMADRFYERVSKELNLSSLCELMQSLVAASENRLRYMNSQHAHSLVEPTVLLRRLSTILINLSTRPLIHVMKIWPKVAPHMVQCACLRGNDKLNRFAIESLGDCTGKLMCTEAIGFCYNQLIFQPLQVTLLFLTLSLRQILIYRRAVALPFFPLMQFADQSRYDNCLHQLMVNLMVTEERLNILCAEMCSEESQEQIVTILATFVHMHAHMIGSGWRPLFSALKALHIENHTEPESRITVAELTPVSSVQATVLDIFSTYLGIKNTNVLLSTVLDYITCVLQYLQSTGPEEEAVVTSSNVAVASTALQNLLKVERMLHDLSDSADCADPHLLHSSQIKSAVINTASPDADFLVMEGICKVSNRVTAQLTLRERNQQSVDRYTDITFLVEPLSTVLIEEPFADGEQKSLATDLDCLLEAPQTISPWKIYTAPMKSCVEVYLSLLEGLTAVIFVCPAPLQFTLLRTIADLIRDQINNKFGINFGAYGLSVLVFPMLQQWMRKNIAEHENSLKQAVGLFVEVVKQYVLHAKDNRWVDRALFDILTLLNECITCTSNRIARLGYACLRFLIRSIVHTLTEERWTIVVRSLWNATSLTLMHLRLLMQYYVIDSNDPNGDVGEVRIATVENTYFSQETLLLAQQIFLMDEQICSKPEPEKIKLRVVVLSHDGTEQRIDGQGLVSILTSHQYILELIGTLLLNGIDLPVDGQTAAFLKKFNERVESDVEWNLHKISPEDLLVLFHCLDASFIVAQNFDKRPGLKMFTQGLFDFAVLPNMCKQTVLAWTVRSLALYEMVRKCPIEKKSVAKVLFPPKDNETGQCYVKQLQLCQRKVCTCLCVMEKKLAVGAIRQLARSHFSQQITLIRDDDAVDNDLYKLISSEDTTEIINEYKRSKSAQSLVSSSKRHNPFRENNEQYQQITTEEKLILFDGEIRCYAWVEMSIALLEASLREENETFEKLLPIIYENATILISGSANMRVREFAGRFLRKLQEYQRFL